MTSASLGSWAEDGLKELLGRKRPTGLGPTGQIREVPRASPEKRLRLQPACWAPIVPRWAGVSLTAQPAFYPEATRDGSPSLPLGARRAPRRRNLPVGVGSGGTPCLRWGALVPGAASRPRPGSRLTFTVQSPVPRYGGAVSTA
jgi:hypothetical protein